MATALTLGTLRRHYFGIPQRPATATPEMITAAERVTRLYVQIRLEQYAPNNVDDLWIQDVVNEKLIILVDFAENHHRVLQKELQDHLNLFQSHFNNPEDLALIRQWINMCGYEIAIVAGSAMLSDACPHA